MRTRLARWGFNMFPAFRGTGGKITYISKDWNEVRIKLPLSWRTRNYVGTIFGGSMYGVVDPIFMVMLIKQLGSEYVVWDKAAHIRFRKPGRTTLSALFTIPPGELEAIKTTLRVQAKVERDYVVELTDREGEVHAIVTKTIHIRQRKKE